VFHLFTPFRLFNLFRTPGGGEYIPPDPVETPDRALRTADGEYVLAADGEYVVVASA